MGQNVRLRIVAGAVLLLLAAVLLPFVLFALVARRDFQSAFVFWIVAFPAGTIGFYLLTKALAERRTGLSYSELDLTFARLLKENNWQITASRLAEGAGISIEEARRYLDEKTLVMDGRFSADEQSGEQIYRLQPKPGAGRT
ncbi:hypothetical protein [Gloeobacter kilaueensis]|uniref:Transcriptional regulator n=1 Tax=Gloeobacter kilaueensis (strain ATCC BAA-2537 / CCAP 1431/1 / ULC 316 / JS1) TaxID=1183438 RepID=U5QJP5_GLOK1|nr:hypothetical protein [Gloeobacter kilaueensis]AGY59113.1 transcriptional regulator [Gloeobacter kilaueensis JS1]